MIKFVDSSGGERVEEYCFGGRTEMLVLGADVVV